MDELRGSCATRPFSRDWYLAPEDGILYFRKAPALEDPLLGVLYFFEFQLIGVILIFALSSNVLGSLLGRSRSWTISELCIFSCSHLKVFQLGHSRSLTGILLSVCPYRRSPVHT